MKKVYIGFSKSNKRFPVFSWLIRLWQWTSFSHVYIKIIENNNVYVYQASGTKVNLVIYKSFLENYDVIKEVPLCTSNHTQDTLIQFLDKQLNKKYGYKQILAILLKRLGIRWSILRDGDYSYICSELVADVLTRFFNFKFSKKIDLITPKDIHKALE